MMGFAEAGCCLLKRIDKLLSEAGNFLFVPGSSFNQFFGSFLADLYLHNQLIPYTIPGVCNDVFCIQKLTLA